MKIGLSRILLALALLIPVSSRATVSIEFQFGGVNAPAGSLGVVVADTVGDGFAAPGDFPSVALAPGSIVGTDDVIVAVFSNAGWPEFAGKRGFADHVAVLDYDELGVAEGQELVLYIFPDRAPGEILRTGEPHLTYLADELGGITSNSSMEFELPADGGAYLLSVIEEEIGGEADLASLDIGPIPLPGQNGEWERTLGSGERHTYYFNMDSAGFFALQTSGGEGLTVELYRGSELVSSSDGTLPFWFEGDLEAGWHTLVIRSSYGTPIEVDYEVQVSSQYIRTVRPDVSIGTKLSSLRDGVVGLVSRKARRVRAFTAISNRGDRPEMLSVSGSKGKRFFRVVYKGSTGNVTATVTSGRFRTPELSLASSSLIRTIVVPDKKRLVRKSRKGDRTLRKKHTSLFTARSTLQPSISDNGWLRVITR